MGAKQAEQDERARLLAIALADFPTFARSLATIVTKSGQRTHLRFNAIQRRYHEARTARDVVLKPRQIGLSTLELARDVWKFLQPGQRVLVICQTDKDQTYLKKFSADVARHFDGLRAAGVALPFGVEATGSWSLPGRDSFLQIIESGASEAAAQKKGRGGTFTRVHSTEAAFYEYPEKSLNATLEGVPNVPGTEIIFESTPNGAGTWFHNLFTSAESGANGYEPHFFTWFDDPTYALPLEHGERVVANPESQREVELVEKFGISPEQLKWYRQKVTEKGQDLVDQEYPSDPTRCFLVSGRTFFDKASTEELFKHVRAPNWVERSGALRVWDRPLPGKRYVMAADPSEGTGGDPGAATIRERETGRHVATLYGQFPTWEMGRLLAEVGKEYNDALVVVERNNHGHAVLQSLDREQKYRNVYKDADDKPGWNNSAVSRATALESLEKAHRTGEWSTPDARVLGEIRSFIVGRDGKPQAQAGSHDDLVLAEAILHDVLSKPHAPIRPPKATNQYRLGQSRGF